MVGEQEGRQTELILRQAQDDSRGKEDTAAQRAAATGKVKGDILVATRQYAKRQLTWFAREPNLQTVMLTGDKPLSTVLRAVVPDLF
jgi:tRNA A37 N6-isopentenylltransferase MiaA